MRQTRNMLLIVLLLVIAGGFGLFARGMAGAQGRKKPGKWKENVVGVVPNEFGDVVALTGTPNNWAMLFKNDEGELRLVQLRGSKINESCFLLKRKY